MVNKDGMGFRSRGSWRKEEQHPTGCRRLASPSPVRAGVGWERDEDFPNVCFCLLSSPQQPEVTFCKDVARV